MNSPARLLPLVGAYNFRDLGGYPTDDGRLTRWGRLYRSDTLHELTDEDVSLLRDIGLESIIDLRTPTEVQRNGRGALGNEPIRYVNLSVLSAERAERAAAPAARIDDVPERYLSYLEDGKGPLVASFDLMADPDNYPLVFHCQAGKDRTGFWRRSCLAASVSSARRSSMTTSSLRRAWTSYSVACAGILILLIESTTCQPRSSL